VAVLAVTISIYAAYSFNMARWRASPDFGWRTMYDSGPNVVAEVFASGAAAGLRQGDYIEAINGRPYTGFDELFFQGIRRTEEGSSNSYRVVRDGKRIDITVPTGRLGLASVAWRSGPAFLIGLFYVVVGALVFLMKPRALVSWLFLSMTAVVGVFFSYAAPADLLRPTWLYDLRFLLEVTIPATMIHLAVTFPKTRTVVQRRPWLAALAYLPSLGMFLTLELTTAAFWQIPRYLYLLYLFYTLLGVVVFLGSMAWNAVKDGSIIVRLQSRVILIGILLGFLVPTTDLLARFLWHAHLFPDPGLSFAVALAFFPVAIGYTIVKHDLFAIDVIVRRTYGYVLSTGAVVGVYAVLVSGLNATFQSSAISTSPLFSIGFALAVVFLFEPIHRRFQAIIDRLFYRQQYDYRSTIKNISEAMTSLLDREIILKTLLGSVVKEMFLERGVVFLTGAGGYLNATVREGGEDQEAPPRLPPDDALVAAVRAKGDIILRHEVEMNPVYEPERDRLRVGFTGLSSVLVMPIIYKGELRGLIGLGRKKSGKLFTREDLDLLRTITNQSAIALENATLFNENLAKGRMEEELKIAHDIQASMLPERAPDTRGIEVAAMSLPAREVGGDFYDFMEIGAAGAHDRLGIVVGDVSGKGVSAALMMAASRSTYRVLVQGDPPIAELMRTANQRLHADIKRGMFVALLYAVFDASERALTVANAGQTEPIICPSGGKPPFYLTTSGDRFPLGIVPDCEYEASQVSVAEGDIMVFYTDGVVEAMDSNGEVYGFERLIASVDKARDLPVGGVLEQLLDDVRRHVGSAAQHDDLTIVVGRVR
jgi:sigma-B regulation protein RsbU (phosphoserine phosphatase)